MYVCLLFTCHVTSSTSSSDNNRSRRKIIVIIRVQRNQVPVPVPLKYPRTLRYQVLVPLESQYSSKPSTVSTSRFKEFRFFSCFPFRSPNFVLVSVFKCLRGVFPQGCATYKRTFLIHYCRATLTSFLAITLA